MSPTRSSVVFAGEYIRACHPVTSSRVSVLSVVPVPDGLREYGAVESYTTLGKMRLAIASALDIACS
jgi:hypothetical protein